jgi:8-oxo-dGTP pyrophosphatase MutT (NUDIX family)
MGLFNLESFSVALGQRKIQEVDLKGLIPAAVMILLYQKEGEYCVLLNERSQQVEHHKGEMSFPGGARDPEDSDFLDTALRETEEEMGISREDVRILGRLDDIITRSNFAVKVYVGTIPYPYEFTPSEIEIAQVVEAPLSALLDKVNHRYETKWMNGGSITAVSYACGDHLVFGATAKILQQFLMTVEEV